MKAGYQHFPIVSVVFDGGSRLEVRNFVGKYSPFSYQNNLKGRKDVFNIPMEEGCLVYKINDPDKKNDLWIHGETIEAVSQSCNYFHKFLA